MLVAGFKSGEAGIDTDGRGGLIYAEAKLRDAVRAMDEGKSRCYLERV